MLDMQYTLNRQRYFILLKQYLNNIFRHKTFIDKEGHRNPICDGFLCPSFVFYYSSLRGGRTYD